MKRILTQTSFSLFFLTVLLLPAPVGVGAQTFPTGSVISAAEPAITFTATPQDIRVGQSSTLSWNSPTADSCVLTVVNGGFLGILDSNTNVPITGTQTVSPSSTTDYKITCKTSNGSNNSVKQTVNVNPCPADNSCNGYTVSINFTSVTVKDSSNTISTIVSSPTHGPITINANPSDFLTISTKTTTTGGEGLFGILGSNPAECITWPTGTQSLDQSEGFPIYSTQQDSWLGKISGFDSSTFSVNYSTNQITLTSVCSTGGAFVFGGAQTHITDSVQLTIQTGQVNPQQVSSTLSAILSAIPSTVVQPGINQTGTTTLTTTVGGTATGSVTYTFYCDVSGNPKAATSSNTTTCGYNSPDNYTAKVVVKRAGLSTTATTKVTVQAPGPSVSLQASPSSIRPANSSTLSWSSTNANSCTATGPWPGGEGAKNLSGSVSVSPSQSTTYYLSCSGPGGTAATSATVMIQGAPTLDIKIQ